MSKEFAILTAIEFGPLTVFFVASYFIDFYTASLLLVITTLAALVVSQVRYKRFAHFSFWSGLFVIVCGTLTVWLHDARWMVLEYTVSNVALGAAILYAYYKQHPLLKDLFGHMFLINENGWMELSWNWGMLFVVTGITNQLFWWAVAHDEYQWTLFRFAVTILIFLFGMYQFRISKRERLEGSSPWGLRSHVKHIL